MTEAEKSIEAPKAEETDVFPKYKTWLYKKAKIHPHLPTEHFQFCSFSEPIYILDENSLEYRSEYDLMEFDMMDTIEQPRFGHIAYEDILLQNMMALYDDKRKEFIVYQVGIHKNPKLWLEELRQFWIGFRKHIVELEDKEFYDDYLAIIDKVSKRKMKELADFKWNGTQVSLVELAITLYEMGVIDINKGKYSVTQFIEAFASAMGIEMDNTTANNNKTKIIGKASKGSVEEKDLSLFNKLKKTFSNWLEDERTK